MKYELPKLPNPDCYVRQDYGLGDWSETWAHSDEQMRQYAEQSVAPLLAEIERLKRGEFICNSCGLRKNADTPEANF